VLAYPRRDGDGAHDTLGLSPKPTTHALRYRRGADGHTRPC